MEQHEYLARKREARATRWGLGLGSLGAASAYIGSETNVDLMAATYGALVDLIGADGTVLDVPGSGLAIAGGAAAVALAQGRRLSRKSKRYARVRRLRAKGWMGRIDLRTFTGRAAMVTSAAKTRPDLGKWERISTRTTTELGVYIGRAISGGRGVRPLILPGTNIALRRGAKVFSSFEEGVLVLGEPGSWKSAWMANQVIDHPGPALIVSTKPEFWDACRRLREQRGPVWIFDPFADTPAADEYLMHWDLVDGCRDVSAAQRRAEALMAAAMGDGIKDGSFWEGRGRYLMTSLLVAADYEDYDLRRVAYWLQSEDYTTPLEILEHAAARGEQIEDVLIGTMRQFTQSKAGATSGSASQTASQVLEFLSNPRLAAALCPPKNGKGFSFDEMLRQGGSLFLVTGESAVLSPIVSAFAAELREAAKRLVREQGHRLAPPLALMYDEAHLTVGGVPIDQHSAELRGWGVTHIVATQNYAQLISTWGEQRARSIAANLQTRLVLGLNDVEDRKLFSELIGTRTETHITESYSRPTDLTMLINPLKRGHAVQTGEQQVEVDLWPAEAWSDLRPGQGVVIPPRGRPAVVSIEHGLIRAAQETARLDAVAAAEARQQKRFAEVARAAERATAGRAESEVTQ